MKAMLLRLIPFYTVILLCTNSLAQNNDYIFLEDHVSGSEHYYFPYDVDDTEQMNNLFYVDSTEFSIYPSQYRFWVVKENKVVKYLSFPDSSQFNYRIVDSLKLARNIRSISFTHPRKQLMVDSLRKLNIPFMFEYSDYPEHRYEVNFNCYFKPEEFSPWQNDSLETSTWFYLREITDSLVTIVENKYPDAKINSMSAISGGRGNKGAHFMFKLYLKKHPYFSPPPFDIRPLLSMGFTFLTEVEVEDRVYWVWPVRRIN
jgi:hypothetical protein